MEKIAWVKKENERDLEIPTIMQETNKLYAQKYNEILTKGIESYLGRSIDLENDAPFITLVEPPDGHKRIFYKDELIGTIVMNIGYDMDDFVVQKVTTRICFIPNSKLCHD